jgi:hypothetical protein
MTSAVAAEDNVVPAQPICASGASYNAAAGVCQRPSILACPTGMTPSGDQCVAPSTCPPGATGPDRGTCTDPNGPNGPLMTRVSCPGYSQAIGNTNTCTGSPTYTCPSGQTLSANNQVCTSPLQGWRCPPGGTLSGTNCIMPAKAATPAATPASATPAPDATAAARPSSRGLQLAATGSSRTRPSLGLAGWAFVAGGLLLVAGAEPLRRRSRQRA